MAHLRNVRVLTLDAAKAMASAAEVFAKGQNWAVAIAIVDTTGGLIFFQCLDGTQPASQNIAVQKARTAAGLKRATKAIEDAVAGGRVTLLGLEGIIPLDGGLPVVVEGEVVGAIGVSGMTSSQDGEVALAGLAAFSPE
jgi:uncharacterized protein GlcG (DUF336 family)